MSTASRVRRPSAGAAARMLVAASLGLGLTAAPAPAQDLTPESAAALKSAFMADIEVMRGKFLGLAEAFPRRTEERP